MFEEGFTPTDAARSAYQIGQFSIDTLAAGTQLASALAANQIAPGGAILLNGLNAFGSETRNARQKGADLGQQLAAGAGNVALSLGTEKLFNVAPSMKSTYGEGLLDSPLAAALETAYKSSVGRMGISALTEGGEEFVEALAQPILQRIIYDPTAEIDLGDAFYQGFVGAAVGGAADGVDVVISSPTDAAFLSGFLGKDFEKIYDYETLEHSDVNKIVQEPKTDINTLVQHQSSKNLSDETQINSSLVESSASSEYNKEDEIRRFIQSPEIPKNINIGHQCKHIKDSNGYIAGRSYILGDLDTAQGLVDKYHGTGEPLFTRDGIWKNKELIQCDEVIGVNIDPKTGVESETRLGTIHYGKNGPHIVPRKERK